MISVKAIDHVGIRVADPERAIAFYAKLGFELVWRGGPEPVAILKNTAGVELNLILNGVPHESRNVLMDVPTKWPGYTHMALQVSSSIDDLVAKLGELGIAISGGPLRLGEGMALFVRDPDGNVIELREPVAGEP
ncbi:MAG TPA: VOC family protein [Polyangiaceae bacterium]|jgi:lactoylglutathione lyase|nr:VOC family protein [Polyangiaceae bacterium]